MTPSEEYLLKVFGNIPTASISMSNAKLLMDNFAYDTLKNLYNSLGKEHSVDTILETIANYKSKFHQYE